MHLNPKTRVNSRKGPCLIIIVCEENDWRALPGSMHDTISSYYLLGIPDGFRQPHRRMRFEGYAHVRELFTRRDMQNVLVFRMEGHSLLCG